MALVETAMLVDDSDIDRLLYRRVVDRSPHVAKLIDFDNGEAALGHLRRTDREPVDLILLDIRMPCMDGFEFLERAGAEFGRTFVSGFVVVLTTSTDPRDIARATRFDIVAEHRRKPLCDASLETIVQRLVARRARASTLAGSDDVRPPRG